MTTDALGSWHWHGDAASATTVMGEPDLFRMLSGNPNVTVRPDGPPILMDRGSGVDEMLVLLDGFPIWSPVHSGGVLSVISPDAVDGLILHDDAMPAQYGGRLASVLDFHPRVADNDSVNGSITFGSVASRVMAQRPVHFGSASGDALLAIRRSNVDFFPYRSTSQSILDRWGDGVGMFSLAHGATTLRFLALASSDRLGQIPWGTRTIGVNWMQQVAPTAHLETRIWKADFHTNMSQGTDSAALALDNGAHQLGMSSQLNWGSSTFGTSLEMMDVRYNVNATATTSTDSSSGLRPTLNLRAAPILATAFADRHWGLATGLWEAQTGFRATGLLGGKVFLEPRVSAAVRLNSAITATAGYARTHQFVQSLRNPNAQLSTLIGIDLPVAAGSGGVPIAQSDAVTAALSAHVSPYLQLALTSYVRRLSGLALPDSSNTALFAERGFENAVGRAAGAGAALAGQAGNGRFAWQVTYGISHVRYSGAGITAVQTPTLSQTSTASLTFQFDRLTQLRVVGWEGTGPQATWFAQVPTVGIPDRTEVESETGGGGDPSRGSGQTLFQTGVEQRNLPQYLRFDLNATHEWSVGSPHGKLAVFLTLANVFNHANVATYDSAASGGTRTITLVPRSLLAGITWRY
jgi:hypothetical protein